MRFALLLCFACDQAPVIEGTTVVSNTFDTVGPYLVTTLVRDPDEVDRVSLFWRKSQKGETVDEFASLTLSGQSGAYQGEIPGTGATDYTVEYYVQAEDAGVLVTDPEDSVYSFDVLRQYSGCEANEDCGPGEVCDEAFCSVSAGTCESEADCPAGTGCDSLARCRPAVRACGSDNDCITSEICSDNLCVPRSPCEKEANCPSDFACDEALGFCLRTCDTDSDCSAGRHCEAGSCVPGKASCKDAADCPSGQVCDLDSVCRDEGAGVCAPCGSDADCGGPTDYCLYDFKQDLLFCGLDCSEEPCPEGFSCEVVADPPQCLPKEGC